MKNDDASLCNFLLTGEYLAHKIFFAVTKENTV